MRGRAHLWISAFLCQAFATAVFRDFTPIPLIIGAFSALWADIDEEQSKISYFLIKGFGGKKRIGGVNHHKTDTQYNSRIKKMRQCALTFVLLLLSVIMYMVFKNVFFSLVCCYMAILPWTVHRTLSHSIFSSMIIGILMYLGFRTYGVSQYGVYFGVGYFLHILEDSFTVSGTPLLYPFSKKRFKIPIMSTGTTKGSLVESVFMLISCIICILTYATVVL